MTKIMIFLSFAYKTMTLDKYDKWVFSGNIAPEDNMTWRVTGNGSITSQNSTLLMTVL